MASPSTLTVTIFLATVAAVAALLIYAVVNLVRKDRLSMKGALGVLLAVGIVTLRACWTDSIRPLPQPFLLLL
jgi:hypothetical protein